MELKLGCSRSIVSNAHKLRGHEYVAINYLDDELQLILHAHLHDALSFNINPSTEQFVFAVCYYHEEC